MEIELIETNAIGNTLTFQSRCSEPKWILGDVEFTYEDQSINLETVPKSILNVAYVLSIMPMCLYVDVNLHVDELDKVFCDNFPKLLESFSCTDEMWKPRMNMFVETIVRNQNNNPRAYGSISLFSGGVDAWFTALKCRNENPLLLHVVGLDYKPWNYSNNTKDFLDQAQKKLGMQIVKCRTNIRQTLRGIDWEHSDHAMRTMTHAIPLAWISNSPLVLLSSARRILSPYSPHGNQFLMRPNASATNIVNVIEMTGTRFSTIGQEYLRTQKIQYIIDNVGLPVKLHVCWETQSGRNCCKCAKCCGTIYALLKMGLNPMDFGFPEIHQDLIEKHKKPLWDW